MISYILILEFHCQSRNVNRGDSLDKIADKLSHSHQYLQEGIETISYIFAIKSNTQASCDPGLSLPGSWQEPPEPIPADKPVDSRLRYCPPD